MRFLFSQTALRILPLSFVFCILNMISLGVVFFVLSFYPACWICGLQFLIKLGKLWTVFLQIIFFRMYSPSFVSRIWILLMLKHLVLSLVIEGLSFSIFFLAVFSGFSIETEPRGDMCLSAYLLFIYQSKEIYYK